MSVIENPAIEQPKESRAWMWALGVAAVLLLGHGVARQVEGLQNFAYSVGFWLLPIALGTWIFCAVFKASREFRYRVFAILYGSALVGGYLGSLIQKDEANRAMDSMKASMTNYANQVATDPHEMPKQIELQPVTATASGNMGVMEVVAKQLLNDAATLQNSYLKALEASGWTSILDVERLKKDAGMKESLRIVEATKTVVQEYRGKSEAILDSLPERAKAAPFRSESSRRQFLQGAEKGQVAGRANNAKTWDFEQAIIQEYSGIIELLARRQGHYEFDKDNNVLFESDADIETYNNHMAKADELVKQQGEHVKNVQANTIKMLDQSRPN
jgi:hypothetical protein